MGDNQVKVKFSNEPHPGAQPLVRYGVLVDPDTDQYIAHVVVHQHSADPTLADVKYRGYGGEWIASHNQGLNEYVGHIFTYEEHAYATV
jgi:hypothetical protein